MSELRHAGTGMLGVVARDAGLYFSHRRRALVQAFITLLSLTLFYYVSRLVGHGRFATSDEYFAYVVVGLALLHGLTATLAVTPTAVRTELMTGTFERLVVSATGPVACCRTLWLVDPSNRPAKPPRRWSMA